MVLGSLKSKKAYMSQIAFKAIRIQKAFMASFIEVFNFHSYNINCYKSGHNLIIKVKK